MMTTIKHSTIVIALSFITAVFIPFFFRPSAEKRISYKTFETEMGWGYDIFINKRQFIHQEFIPSLERKRGFLRKYQAERTAEVIINKMKRKGLPSVTKFEIQQILSEPCN
jgi:hypothetical protein